MSDNVIQENAYEPQGNSYDGSEQAYEQADQAQSLENALNEKKETEELQSKINELEQNEQTEQIEETEEPKNDEFSSKFAALSRREKQLREREMQLQEQYESKLAELEQRIQSLQQPETIEETTEPELPLEYRLKKNPLKTLEELGLSYDTLTNLALNDGNLTPEMKMELMQQEIDQKYSKQIEELKNELLERDKRAEEEKYEETVNNFKNEIANFVNDNDEYVIIIRITVIYINHIPCFCVVYIAPRGRSGWSGYG